MSFTNIGQAVTEVNNFTPGSSFNLPAGTAAGDLLTIHVFTNGDLLPTLPSGWVTRFAVNNNDTANLRANAVRGYIIRGASLPATVLGGFAAGIFIRAVVKAYRPNSGAVTFVGESSINMPTTAFAPHTWAGLSGLQPNDLLDMGLSSGRGHSWSDADAATDPSTASGAGEPVTTGMPAAGSWVSRWRGAFVGGSSNSWYSADGVMSTAGATGNFSVTTDLAAAITGSVMVFRADATAATAITLTGPSSGTVGSPSTNFTAGANGPITGTITVTPSDGGDGGTFTPTSVAISSASPTATFTYTAANAGSPTATITVTNNGGLTNPSGIAYSATVPSATQIVLSVPDAAGLSGFSGVVLSAAAPGSGVTVIATPTSITFNGSGQATIDITGLGIAVGAYRWVTLTNSNGTTTQSPAPVAASGPVIAS
jgi:hypothetical protein